MCLMFDFLYCGTNQLCDNSYIYNIMYYKKYTFDILNTSLEDIRLKIPFPNKTSMTVMNIYSLFHEALQSNRSE